MPLLPFEVMDKEAAERLSGAPTTTGASKEVAIGSQWSGSGVAASESTSALGSTIRKANQ